MFDRCLNRVYTLANYSKQKNHGNKKKRKTQAPIAKLPAKPTSRMLINTFVLTNNNFNNTQEATENQRKTSNPSNKVVDTENSFISGQEP